MSADFTLTGGEHNAFHTGLAIPVFSLRTEQSSGVGQFSDLKKLADFAKKTQMDVIQLLPINDTTTFMDWRDSYPYRAISVFALHPIYLDIHNFQPYYTKLQKQRLAEAEEELNELEQLDYERVLALKWQYAKFIYRKCAVKVKDTAAYLEFYEKNKNWLEPYAVFSYLRDKYKTADFTKWKTYAGYSSDYYKQLQENKDAAKKLDLLIFVQYLLHQQLTDAVHYCHSLGIALKGDIAIGIARDSVDAWTNPNLFHLEMQTGAPPDAFSMTGQNWGFPTYNWAEMAKENYDWWKKRLLAMAEYFDAYRLDHILGFFRIWEIPAEAIRGLLGQFSPALALSPEEIEQNYGIPFREWGIERFTEPFIKDWVIDEIFGRDNRDTVIQNFLNYKGHGNYEFNTSYNSQKKIERAPLADWLKEGLYILHENVIFLKDHTNDHLYHPRITFTSTISFREFGEDYKKRLEKLYNDYFYGRNDLIWQEEAYKKLPILKEATAMVACGEDLGMVPENVPDVMYRLGILRLIIERMPSDNSFVNPLQYAPYLSVVTTSSHDTSPLRAWWEEDYFRTQRYYNEIMGWQGAAPKQATVEIVKEIIGRHLSSNAMMVILPLQDWLALDEQLRKENPQSEQINIPSEPFHYWRYRLHCTIESLLENEEWTDFLARFVSAHRK